MLKKISKKVLAVALVAMMAIPAVANTADAAPKAKLNLKKKTIKQGKSFTLKANKKATWASSNVNVAQVNAAEGKKVTVIASKPGKANITATIAGKKATCKVTVKKASKGTVIYNLANETGVNPETGESWAPPQVCNYNSFKYDSFSMWLCRATFYGQGNYASPDWRGRKLNISIKVKNSGARDLPELGVCFNYTSGGTDGAYPFALHVSEKALSKKVKGDAQHRHCKFGVKKIKKGKTYTYNFTFTIPSNAMNGDKDDDGYNYPIMMYIPNLKDSGPYKPGDEITVLACKIKVA